MSSATVELPVDEVTYLAECYVPGLTHAQVERAIGDLRTSVATLDSGHGSVRCVGSIFVPADEVVFHLFAAPSIEVVRVVCARAGLACERIAHSIGMNSPRGV